MRSLAILAGSLFVLSACDGVNIFGEDTKESAAIAPVAAPETPAAPTGPVQGAAESMAPETLEIPDQISKEEGLVAGFMAGRRAILRTDACPAGYDDVAKLGSIMCGKDYGVFYEASTMRWAAIGPDRGLDGATAAAKNPGPSPTENIVVLWGLSLIANPETLEASHGDGNVIGHFILSDSSAVPPK